MDEKQKNAMPTPATSPAPEAVLLLPAGPPVKKKANTLPIILGGVGVLVVVVGFIVLLMLTGSEGVGKIRDIFIIFMALESLVIGVVLAWRRVGE